MKRRSTKRSLLLLLFLVAQGAKAQEDDSSPRTKAAAPKTAQQDEPKDASARPPAESTDAPGESTERSEKERAEADDRKEKSRSASGHGDPPAPKQREKTESSPRSQEEPRGAGGFDDPFGQLPSPPEDVVSEDSSRASSSQRQDSSSEAAEDGSDDVKPSAGPGDRKELCREPDETPPPRVRHSWDPRAGYGLCPEICGQDEACIDGRCQTRCSPSCREGTYCTAAGECLPMPEPPRDEPTERELQIRLGKSSRDATKAAFVDVGGILFLGARPTFEWGARHSFHVRALLMNTGFMSYFLQPQTEFERFEWGFGGSIGYRRYESQWGNLRGFYYGGGLSYSLTEVRDDSNQRYAIRTHHAGASLEFGYRWVFHHFLFGFGPSLGARVPLINQFRAVGEGSCVEDNSCSRKLPTRFEGTMVVEVGWFP